MLTVEPRTPVRLRTTARSRLRWPVERRASDARLLALASIVLIGAALAARYGHPTVVEVNLFRLINELPSPLSAPLIGVMQLGALGAVPVIAAIAAMAGRYRIAVVTSVAGVGAWSAGKLVQYLVDADPPVLRLSHVVLHGTALPGGAFPSSHVAVAAAITVVVAPYFGRPGRRIGWMLTACIAFARVYVGLHMPIDVLGGLALGILAGSIVNLILAVPARGPKPEQLGRVLEAMSRHVVELEPLDAGCGRAWARTADGDAYFVKSVGWEFRDQGWISRIWRFGAFREVYTPAAPSSPAHRSDHEALMTVVAERGGVRVPHLVATEDVGRQTSVVIRQWVEATPLGDAALAVSDPVLADVWHQLGAVRDAGLVHRRLQPEHVLVDVDGGAWLVGWSGAQMTTDPDERASDVAELAVTLSASAGAARTVSAGVAALGPAAMLEAFAHLQPLALAKPARTLVDERPALLAELRSEIAALDGRPTPEPLSPNRVAARNLLPVAAVGVALYVLLPRLVKATSTLATLEHAQWPWLVVVAVAAAATYLMAAVALIGAAGRPLPFGRTAVVQVAATCANRVTPAGLGAVATNIRYLELAGLSRTDAATALLITSAAGFVVHVLATVVFVGVLHHGAVSSHVPEFENVWPALAALAAASVGLGWILWAKRVHRAILEWVRTGMRHVGDVLTQPGRLSLVLVGVAGISASYVVALDGALHAFGVHLSLVTVTAVFMGASAVAAAAPLPGGLGTFEAAAVAGLGSLHVAAAPAVAAVISYRLITYWLPVVPGSVALHVLRRHEHL